MSFFKSREKPNTRNRGPVKRWNRNDEIAIINYIKQNRDFERPNARIYYTKLIEESGINVDWKLLFYKVRNMRKVYRRSKEYQMNREETKDKDAESVKNVTLKICWYVNEFDVLFPNDMNDFIPEPSSNDDNETSNHNISITSNINNFNDNDDNANTSYLNNSNFNEEFIIEESVLNHLPQSIRDDIWAVQRGKFQYKQKKFNKDINIRTQELNKAREKFTLEKEQFQLEIKLKEKEIDSKEKLKIMELQMQERLALKELEIKEKLAFNATIKYDNSF